MSKRGHDPNFEPIKANPSDQEYPPDAWRRMKEKERAANARRRVRPVRNRKRYRSGPEQR